jgi:hypothetical protein
MNITIHGKEAGSLTGDIPFRSETGNAGSLQTFSVQMSRGSADQGRMLIRYIYAPHGLRCGRDGISKCIVDISAQTGTGK